MDNICNCFTPDINCFTGNCRYCGKTLRKDSVRELKKENKIPIKRGCNNAVCFCSGKCNEIIGWKDV